MFLCQPRLLLLLCLVKAAEAKLTWLSWRPPLDRHVLVFSDGKKIEKAKEGGIIKHVEDIKLSNENKKKFKDGIVFDTFDTENSDVLAVCNFGKKDIKYVFIFIYRCWDSKHYLLLFAPLFPSKHNLADSSDHFSVVGQTVQHHVLNKHNVLNNNALQEEEVDAQLLDQTTLLEDKTYLSPIVTRKIARAKKC